MSETKLAPSCFICFSCAVCKGKEDMMASYFTFGSYWNPNDKLEHLLFFLASKCVHYNFIGADNIEVLDG